MLKEYKTISEVTGPLMLVKGVEGVGYDELGEIELPNGDIRHCRVLEINGDVYKRQDTGSAGSARYTGYLRSADRFPDLTEDRYAGRRSG